MAIIKCPECGHQISEKATVCPSCGVEIAGKIAKCTSCGEVFFKDYGLCPHCYRPYQPIGGVSQTDIAEDNEPTEEDTVEAPQKEDVASEANTVPTEHAEETTAPQTIQNDLKKNEKDDDEEDYQDQSSLSDEIEESESSTTSDVNDKEDKAKPSSDNEETIDDDNDDEIKYIDTDEENLEKPEHQESDDENNSNRNKRGYLPVVVSIAIAALIAAVCLYFYNDSKLSIENNAFELAYDSGDVDKMKTFLRNHPDATDAHKRAITNKIDELTKQKQDYSMGIVTRDKAKLQQYLVDYPKSPHKQTILAMIDSIDWEDALRVNSKEGYDKYIAEHSSGIFIKEAKEKVSVKITAATAEDQAMAKSLYREFFLSVNGNDASRITPTLNSAITQFMGTSNATSSDVIGWMKNQHGEGVSGVIWKLNHDYKITRREQNGKMEYIVEFTAKRTVNYRDGRVSNENFKISSNVSENKKISSMTMSKYVPSTSDNKTSTSTQSSSKPSTSNTSSSYSQKTASGSSKQSSASSTPKPSSSSTSKPSSSTPKPSSNTSSTSKPSSGSSSTQSGKSGNGTNTQKPKTNSQSGAKSSGNSSSSSSKHSSSQQGKTTNNQSQQKPKSTANTSKSGSASSGDKSKK